MTVKLTSLRVAAAFDASSYTRGAAEKVAADQRMITSDKAAGASMAAADAIRNDIVAGVTRLSKAYVEGYSQASKFQRELDALNNALDRGLQADRASMIYAGMAQKFGLVANAADVAAAGYISLLPVIDQVNARMEAQAEIAQRAAAAMAASSQSNGFQDDLNSRLGVRTSFGADARAADIAAYGQELDRLAAKYDPVFAANQQFEKEISDINRALAVGAIGQQAHGAAIAAATDRLNMQTGVMTRSAAGAKLNRAEMTNLSYQFSDIAVMLASGQSPFLMLMQQGMQVSDVLGPRGLKGGVKALAEGFLAFASNPLTLTVLGFAGAAAGASYFFNTVMSGGPKIEDTLTHQRELLGDLEKAYETAGRQVAGVRPESARVLEFELKINVDQAQADLDKQLDELFRQVSPRLIGGRATGHNYQYPELKAYQEEFDSMRKAIKAGSADVGDLRNMAARLAMGVSGVKFEKWAKGVLEATQQSALLQRQVDAITLSLDRRAAKLSALYGDPRRFIGDEPPPDDLYSQVTDSRGPRLRLEETMNTIRKAAAGSTADLAEAERLAVDIRAQLNAETAKAVALGGLDLRSITARSPAEKAAIAAERERLSLVGQSVDAIDAEVRIQNAAAQAYAQATFAIQEQNRAREQAANDNLSSARLEADLIGKRPDAQAELRANLQDFIDLQRQAADNGLAFDTAQFQRLKGINAQIALQNRLTAVRKLQYDIDTERRLLRMPQRDGELFQRVRGAGIEEGTAAFQKFVSLLRENQELEASFGYGLRRGFEDLTADANDFASSAKQILGDLYSGMEDVWVDFAKTGKLTFTDLIDTMIADVSRLAYKMTMSGIFSLASGAAGGGGAGGLLSGLMGMLGGGFSLNANGAAYGGGVRMFGAGAAFANKVVSSPTMFAYGAGRVGIMGEAGEEAIMPLRRGPDGRLGVSGTGGGGGTINFAPVYQIDARGADAGVEKRLKVALDQRDRNLKASLPAMIGDARARAKLV